ncbi:rCG52299 [Rattus norvegicus]|uniref:RCG52299 n=1 Tax=Rattus norvegicus TaxID=10116 RepID=A6K0N1_RAT|nr:rCG52299 [Rattus norvegicus]
MLVFVTSLFWKLDAKLPEGLASPGSGACPLPWRPPEASGSLGWWHLPALTSFASLDREVFPQQQLMETSLT